MKTSNRSLRYTIIAALLALSLFNLGSITGLSYIKYNILEPLKDPDPDAKEIMEPESVQINPETNPIPEIKFLDSEGKTDDVRIDESMPAKSDETDQIKKEMNEDRDDRKVTENKTTKVKREIMLNGVPISKNHVIVSHKIFFESDKAILTKESMPELVRMIKFLKENPSIKLEISGHTDITRKKEYSFVLSKRRAESVYHYFIEQGIDPGRMTTMGYGYSKRLEDEKLNRRVEFKITDL